MVPRVRVVSAITVAILAGAEDLVIMINYLQAPRP